MRWFRWIVVGQSLACGPDVDPIGDGPGYGCRELSASGAFRTSCNQIQLRTGREVDILFVLDNSGSMGEEQGKLAQAMDALIAGLEIRGEPVNYRIAFTTTDNGNPTCDTTTTPESGRFQLASCRDRLEHFSFAGTDPPTQAADVACLDHCSLSAAELDEKMKPTLVHLDEPSKVRPWMQRLGDETNLPDGVSEVDAARCFVPQGIDGCGFESHLESMYKGLEHTTHTIEDSYGFARRNAVLAVVFVTDEADCSSRNEFEHIFDPSGSKVFWSDPDAAAPTSAVCWNAGVACTGPGAGYDGCEPQDHDENGIPTADSSRAVLYPVYRYADLLQGFEDSKQALQPDQEVVVSVIAGVPGGYPTGDAEIPYADATDPEVALDLGIGPGCTSAEGDAVPPVRLRAFADAFGDRRIFSVCEGDYDAAMTELASRIRDQLPPPCFKDCAADVDPDEDGVQVECRLDQETVGAPKLEIPACTLVNGEYELPSPDDDVCYYPRTDASGSGDPIDDMSPECVEEGWNLELTLVRRPGVEAADTTAVIAQCKRSSNLPVDCPDLG